jgi:nucleotide-binding universal stress UspA family protein
MYTKILLPTDGSPGSFAAAEYARDLLGLNPSARLTILHVRQLPEPVFRVYRWREVEVPLSEEEKRRICEAEELLLAQTQRIFTDAGLLTDTDLVSGTPAEEICAYAKRGGYDLIVIGSINAAKIKTTSHYVLQMAKCPILFVKT